VPSYANGITRRQWSQDHDPEHRNHPGRYRIKPSTAKRNNLTIDRPTLRHICRAMDSIHNDSRETRLYASKLRQFLPFKG